MTLTRRTPLQRTYWRRKPRAVTQGRLPSGTLVRKVRQPPLVTLRRRTVRVSLPPGVRAEVWERCHGRCDFCGNHLPAKGWHAHHRLRRSQGGPDTAVNLAALHDACHDWVHRNVAASRDLGLLLRRGDDPARPVDELRSA